MSESGKDGQSSELQQRLRAQKQTPERGCLSVTPPFPRNVMIELSNGCNHACVFCANPHMTRKVGRMDAALAKRILAEARAEGAQEVGFYTTGEPLVHKQLETLVAFAADAGYSYIYISSNGGAAGPERYKALIDAGLHSIKFSINAASRETYKVVHGKDDFDKVMQNLRFVSDYRRTLGRPLKLYVSFVVTRLTRDEVEAFKAELLDLVDDVLVSQSDAQQGYMAGAQALFGDPANAAPANGTCAMPFNRLHVSCEGYVTLCCVDYQNYLAVADLRTMSVGEAWNSPAFRDARQRHLDDALHGSLCGNCWYSRTDPIEPLVPEYATVIDLKSFHDRQQKAVRERLHLPASADLLDEDGQA